MKQNSFNVVLKHIKQGRVCRRADLNSYSSAIDRDLKQLCQRKDLLKLAPGLYYRPKQSAFGPQAAENRDLVRSFLKDSRFLMTSPNYFNNLGLGLSQLHNHYFVYNYKRHGKIILGSNIFEFKRVNQFPKKLSKEYLVVDLLNTMKTLGEDETRIVAQLKDRVSDFDSEELLKMAKKYGRARTKNLIKEIHAPS